MLAQPIIDLINTITNDASNVTYPLADLYLAINDAQRLVCIHRPDANSSTSNLALVAGSKQTLPSGARRLLDVVRNMGADGSTIGTSIAAGISPEAMDSIDPDWHNATSTKVSKFVYDERRPTEFYIYPGVAPTFYIEIKTADNPTDITSGSSSIDVDDSYAPCLVSWACYRLFSRDGQESPNYARGESHKQMVFDTLGVKITADMAVSPNA